MLKRYLCHFRQTRRWLLDKSWGKYFLLNREKARKTITTILVTIYRRCKTRRSICIFPSNFFGLEKLDKAPREVLSPEIQKVRVDLGTLTTRTSYFSFKHDPRESFQYFWYWKSIMKKYFWDFYNNIKRICFRIFACNKPIETLLFLWIIDIVPENMATQHTSSIFIISSIVRHFSCFPKVNFNVSIFITRDFYNTLTIWKNELYTYVCYVAYQRGFKKFLPDRWHS